MYNLFISHSWNYGDAYEKLTALLDHASYFSYKNYSVPKNDPIHNAPNQYLLKEAIKRQMNSANCVIILAGVYSSYSKWINVEIDLAKKIAKDLGVTAEFVPVTAQTRGPLLDNKQVDAVIATFTITPERQKSYNFTKPYFTDEIGFLVNKASGFKSVNDLDGKTIGVAQSASTKTELEKLGKEKGLSFKYSELSDYPTLKTALTSGRIDAFSVDKSILSGYVDNVTVIMGDGFASQEYGIATKKSNTELADYLDKEIKTLKANGELKKMTDKYDLKDATAK